MLREIVNRIISFFSWLPVIFLDKHNSNTYFYKVIRHKLKLTKRNYTGKHSVSAESRIITKDIEKCIRILDRLIEDDYYSISGFGALYKKWVYPDNEIIKGYPTSVVTKEDKLSYGVEFAECCRKKRFLKEQDRRYVFFALKRNIDIWWN